MKVWVSQYCYQIAFSPDGTCLGTVTHDRMNFLDDEVKLWDVQSGRELVALRRPALAHLKHLAFSPDGNLLAFSGRSSCEVCETATGRTLCKFGALGAGPAFSRDGRLVASDAGLWDPHTGRLVRAFRGSTMAGSPSDAGVTEGFPIFEGSGLWGSLVLDPQGQRFAKDGGGGRLNDDGAIELLEASDGRVLLTLRGHAGPVTSLCFAPDGDRLVSAGQDGTVRIWESRRGRCLLTLPVPREDDRLRTDEILGDTWNCVAINPDGLRVAASSDRIRMWSADPGGSRRQ
jgi:WD40 repeat protein